MKLTLLKIFIVDSHPSFRYGLRQLLSESTHRLWIREFATYEAMASIAVEIPDLIIAGLNDSAQFQMIGKLGRAATAGARILLIYNERLQIRALHSLPGHIDAVLHKEAEIDQIRKAIAELLSLPQKKGAAYLSQNGKVLLHHQAFWLDLSHREFEIAHYLAQGMRTSEISNLMQLKPSTISTYKHRILNKTQTSNIVELRQLMYTDHHLTGI